MGYLASAYSGGIPGASSSAPARSSGALGFLGNLWHDAEDMATGLGALGEQVVHDVGRGAAQALPGHQSWGFVNDTDPTGYHIDDIVKALPGAIAHDYATRYGSLQDIKSGLYNHPLSYLLDLLSVGSMVGKGAEIAGTAALASDAGESITRAVARGVTQGATANTGESALEIAASKARDLMKAGPMTPGLTRKVANPAGVKAGLEALSAQRPLTPVEDLARRILPSASVKKVGETLVPAVAKNNPVARALESPFHFGATESLDRLRAEADTLAETLSTGRGDEPGFQAVANRYAQLKGQITGAENAGLTRIQKPFVSDLYARHAAGKLVGAVRGIGLNMKEQRFHDVVSYVKPYVKQDSTFVDRGTGVMQGLDVSVSELPEHPGAVNMDVVTTAPRVVSVNTAKRGLTTELPAEARNWLSRYGQPGLVDRIDGAVQGVREAVDRYTKAPETIPEGADLGKVTDAADRYISNLYDAAIRKYTGGVPGGKDVADTIQATDDLRLMLSGDNWEGSMLARGNASPESLMRRAYAPLMRKYGAEVNEAGQLVMPDGSDWRQFDDAMRASGHAPPVYFKLIDDNKFAPKNYRDFVFSNTRVGGRRATYDPSLKRMTGTLLKKGSYVKDPVEVFTRRAAQQTRYEEYQNLVEWAIKPNARKIGSLDELMPNQGYFVPTAMRRQIANHMRFDDMRADLMARGVSEDSATAAALKSVVFKNQDDIISAGIDASGDGAEIYAIPIQLANHLDAYAKYALNNPMIRMFYDGPMNAWRAMVLQGSPRWTLNNLLGNTAFVALSGGANLTDVAAIAEQRFKAMLNDKFGMNLDTSLLDDLNRIEGMARVGSGYAGTEALMTPKLGRAAETATGQVMQEVLGSRPVQAVKALGSFNQRANAAVEDVFRQAVYLKALDKTNIIEAAKPVMHGFWDLRGRINRMMSTGYQPEQVNSALTEMAQVMGNYGSLGPFERNVVRHFVFPFWGFFKHQAQFLARLPAEHPLRGAVLNQLTQVNAEMMQKYGPMPEWLQGAVPMGPPGPGDIPFLSSAGPNPFNATFANPISQLSPPIQIALSRLEGHNLYTGAPFTDPNVITPFGSDQSFRVVRDAQGNVVNTVPIKGQPLPGLLEQILSEVPQYQAAENVLAGGHAYDSANLIGALASRITGNRAGVTPVEPGTQTPTSPSNLGSELAKLSGMGTYNYNLSDFQRNQLMNQLRALTEAQSRG